jgi:hypothetical protein
MRTAIPLARRPVLDTGLGFFLTAKAVVEHGVTKAGGVSAIG